MREKIEEIGERRERESLWTNKATVEKQANILR